MESMIYENGTILAFDEIQIYEQYLETCHTKLGEDYPLTKNKGKEKVWEVRNGIFLKLV